MIFKESGYDEFLAKKIQEGLQAADKVEVISSVQLDLEMQALFSKLDRELSQQEAELNGIVYG